MKRQRATSQQPKPKENSSSKPPSEQDSVENHTNLNWETGLTHGKRQKVDQSELTFISCTNESIALQGVAGDQLDELPAAEFYQSSHYFIDELKGEFCKAKADGWFEVRDEISAIESSSPDKKEESQQSTELTGSWTKQEHALFLEGVRLFGKDWDKVAAHIGSRGIKSVISHGQKFLMKLVRCLSKGKPIKELTVLEAEYFHGVLSKRTHWKTKIREEREREQLMSKKVFMIEKVDRKQLETVDEQMSEASEASRSNYERWKAALPGADAKSYHLSLGHSVKMLVRDEGGQSRISFKTILRFEDNFQDDDSGTSQSSSHMRKFQVDEGAEGMLKDPELHKQFLDSLLSTFNSLPDIKEGEDVGLFIKFLPNGPAFNIIEGQTAGSILSSKYAQRSDASSEEVHPNLHKLMAKKYQERLDADDALNQEEAGYPLGVYLYGLSFEQFKEVVANGFKMYYVGDGYPATADGEDLAAQLNGLDLDFVKGSRLLE